MTDTVQVFTPHFTSVLHIPKADVWHFPPKSLNVTRLVLCEKMGDCPLGKRCKFVHASTERATSHDIHVNYAYRKLEDVEYDRLPAGDVVTVLEPNSTQRTQQIPSDQLLKTKAFAPDTKQAPSHCAHYYFNRNCNLGPHCRFVHAVYIDPNAKKHQRAPAPLEKLPSHQQHLAQKSAKTAAEQPRCTLATTEYSTKAKPQQALQQMKPTSSSASNSGTITNQKHRHHHAAVPTTVIPPPAAVAAHELEAQIKKQQIPQTHDHYDHQAKSLGQTYTFASGRGYGQGRAVESIQDDTSEGILSSLVESASDVYGSAAMSYYYQTEAPTSGPFLHKTSPATAQPSSDAPNSDSEPSGLKKFKGCYDVEHATVHDTNSVAESCAASQLELSILKANTSQSNKRAPKKQSNNNAKNGHGTKQQFSQFPNFAHFNQSTPFVHSPSTAFSPTQQQHQHQLNQPQWNPLQQQQQQLVALQQHQFNTANTTALQELPARLDQEQKATDPHQQEVSSSHGDSLQLSSNSDGFSPNEKGCTRFRFNPYGVQYAKQCCGCEN